MALAATAVGVAAVKPLEISGQAFVDPDSGDKFQVVGMAYQPGGSAGYDPETGKDPLSHPEECKRDAALMQILGINTIRVYNLDPDINHDECASIFNAAGMYMMIDVNSPLVGEAITSFQPWTSYYAEYLNRTFAIVEAFSNYPNTLLFFSANEVINDVKSAEFSPRYIRAVTRDLKNYIKNNLKRQIPVGYSAADVRPVLWDTYNYLTCDNGEEDDNMSQADLFALNSYSWCGEKATFESSTFSKLVQGFEDSAVPVFFSEYGCNKPQPRLWNEVQSIYGEDMKDTFSGGVVYEYTMEDNNYGLVKIKGDKLTILSDFNRLKAQYGKVEWKNVQSEKPSKKSSKAVACAAKLITNKGFDTNFTIPDVPPGAQKLIDNGVKPKPVGKLVKISDLNVNLEVVDADGNTMKGLKVKRIGSDEFNWQGKNEVDTGSATHKSSENQSKDDKDDGDDSDADKSTEKDEDEEDAAVLTRPFMWAVGLPLLAMLFA